MSIDPKLNDILVRNGYFNIKELPNGEIAGLLQMMFTVGLCVGLNEINYRTRFCYETRKPAEEALNAWDGEGFPPGFWLKQKPEDVQGPGGVCALGYGKLCTPEMNVSCDCEIEGLRAKLPNYTQEGEGK